MCHKWIGTQSVHHNNLVEHFLNFKNDKHNTIWKNIRVAIVCMIWNHINNRIIFKQEKIDGQEVFCMAQLNT